MQTFEFKFGENEYEHAESIHIRYIAVHCSLSGGVKGCARLCVCPLQLSEVQSPAIMCVPENR